MPATSILQIQEYANAAFESMRQQGIPPTPENFTVWFHFHAGTYGDLNRMVDKYLDSGETFDDTRNETIYARYFGSDPRKKTLGVAAGTERILQDVISKVSTANSNVAGYAAFLRDTSDALGTETAPADVGLLVSGLIDQTRAMQQRNDSLERDLRKSTEEVINLRRDLEATQRDAQTDGLTEIPNRKRFDMTLREAMLQSNANGKPLCLILTDVDHFKKFNDLYGHQMGDQVLKLVGKALRDCVRDGDMPARFGGEEFAVILPDATLPAATVIGDRIRRTIASRRIVRRDSKVELGAITTSVGVALYRKGEPVSALIDRADEALDVAKRTGRNKVVTEEQLNDPETAAL